MNDTVTLFKIVVASPGDVPVERENLDLVVADLNRGIADLGGLRLEVVRWETDTYPGFHPEGLQFLIDSLLGIEDCDILIGIFWRRFGTLGKDGQTGTEHEILKALEAWKKKRRPQIMIYFNQEPYVLKSSEEVEQVGRVVNFQEQFPKEGLWWGYEGERDFERKVRRHLTLFIRKYIGDLIGDGAAQVRSISATLRPGENSPF